MMKINSYLERKQKVKQKMFKQMDLNSELIKKINTNKSQTRSRTNSRTGTQQTLRGRPTAEDSRERSFVLPPPQEEEEVRPLQSQHGRPTGGGTPQELLQHVQPQRASMYSLKLEGNYSSQTSNHQGSFNEEEPNLALQEDNINLYNQQDRFLKKGMQLSENHEIPTDLQLNNFESPKFSKAFSKQNSKQRIKSSNLANGHSDQKASHHYEHYLYNKGPDNHSHFQTADHSLPVFQHKVKSSNQGSTQSHNQHMLNSRKSFRQAQTKEPQLMNRTNPASFYQDSHFYTQTDPYQTQTGPLAKRNSSKRSRRKSLNKGLDPESLFRSNLNYNQVQRERISRNASKNKGHKRKTSSNMMAEPQPSKAKVQTKSLHESMRNQERGYNTQAALRKQKLMRQQLKNKNSFRNKKGKDRVNSRRSSNSKRKYQQDYDDSSQEEEEEEEEEEDEYEESSGEVHFDSKMNFDYRNLRPNRNKMNLPFN
jgi:hypothetical protein